MEPITEGSAVDMSPSQGVGNYDSIVGDIVKNRTPAIEQTDTGLASAQQAVSGIIQQRKSNLNSTFASVSGTNPDEAAAAQSIGGQIGVGQDLAMQNMAAVKKAADQKRFESYDLMAKNPVLGRQMMDREFASVAHDDIPQLTSLGGLFKVINAAATGQPFPPEVAMEIAQQFGGSQYQTEEALIYHWMSNNGLEEKDLNEETRQRLKTLEENAPPPINTYLFGGVSYAAGQMFSMAPEVSKYALTGAVTGAALTAAGGPLAIGGTLGGAGLGATAGIGVVTSQIEGGMLYKELLRNNVPKDVARTVSSIGGTVNGLIEIGTLGLATAPFKAALKKVVGETIIKRGVQELAKPTAISAIKTAGKYFGMEVLGEQVQEISQEMTSIVAEDVAGRYAPGEYESKFSTPEGLKELANRLIDVSEQTFKATAVMGAFGPMLNLAVDAKNIRDSAKTKQFLTDLSKNVQDTKLKGRSPSALANFVAAQAQGTAAETMYVDAEEMVNVLNQSGLTAQQIDNALPGVREQLAQATSGGDIQIPTAQFAANIVGTKLEAPLMEHARLAPDAISAKQAIAQQESMQQNMKDAQVEMAVQEKTNAQFVSEAKEIEKVVNDQLIAAGRPPTEAAFAAKLVQARAVTGAARDGITPAQWVARHPVPTFQSQQQAAQAAQQQVSRQNYKPITSAKVEVWLEKDDDNNIVTRIDYIEVPKSKRLKGEGTKEIKNIIEWSKKNGATSIIVESEREAIPFWKKIGFNITDQGSDVSTGTFDLPLAQGSFEQASRADLNLGEQAAFDEASQRPEVVTWAKEKFGDRTAPDGSSVWQNFTEWFGDSKVVDAEGKPMVVYHGTGSEFNTFETGRGDMIFVSLDANVASIFGTSIIPAYIKSLKPFNGEKNLNEIKDFIKKNYNQIEQEIRTETKNRENDDESNVHSQDELLSRIDGLDYYVFESSETLRNGIKELGFDSIQSDESGFVAIGIFEPTQIKSAIANVGTFGQQDPNILRQELSTRRPSSVTATEDPLTTLLTISHEQTLRTPEVLAKNVEILKKLTPMRFLDENATPEQQLENFLAQASDNLVALYNLMPPELRERAKLWYPGGRRMLDYISSNTGLSPMQVGGVFAVLSPQKDWYENVTLGNRIIDIVTTQSDFVWDEKMSATAAKLKEVARLAAEEAKVLRKAKAEIALTRANALEATVKQPDVNATKEAQAVLEKEAVQARKVSDRLAKAVEKSEDQEDSAAMKLYDDLKGTTLKELLSDPYKAAVWVRVFDQTFNEQSYKILLPEGGVGETRTTQAGKESSLRWAGYGAVAKAISVIVDGRAENVFYQIGNEHKVRNFYNNLFAPESGRYITIDTHAVAAANFMPLAGTDDTVAHAFGGSAASGETGQSGAYSIYFESYRRAAEAVGVLPREMQSITWEAVRGLFEASKKKTFKPLVKNIWEKYKSGELTQEQAREEIIKLVGGITNPSWAASAYNESPGQTYEGVSAKAASEKSVKVKTIQKSEVLFEVAPDPTDANLSSRWDALDPETKHGISANVAAKIVPEVLKEFGVSGEIIPQVGGWQGKTNPGFALRLESGPLTRQVAKALGHALSQQGMFSISAEKFEGSQESGLISIQLPEGYTEKQVGELYEKLWELKHNGKQIIQGHTTIDGKMSIINDTGIDTTELGDMIDKHLGGAFKVTDTKANTAFDSKDTYDTNLQRPAPRGVSILGTRRIDSFRQHATRLIDQEVSRAEEAAGKLNQSAVPATFYSALGVEVGKSTTKSASADSWKQQIKGLIAKGVVKEKEVYWSGLDNWLDLQEGKITKEQVQAFLDAGGVKVEVERSEDEQSASELTARQAIANAKEGLGGLLDLELENTFNEYEKLVVNNLQNQETAKDRARRVELEEVIDEALDAVDMKMSWEFEAAEEQESESFANVFEPKYAGYQLPGGTNYREALVMLPSDALGTRKIMEGDKVVAIAKNDPYRSAHWNQENVLVHLRMNDRVDADGKKVLFVEEVQSDWGQAGREKGFITPIKQEDIDKEEPLHNKLLEANRDLYRARIAVGVEQDRILAKLGLKSYQDILLAGKQRIELTDAYRKLVVDDKEYAIAAEKERLAVAEELRASIEYSAALETRQQTERVPRAPFVETTSGWLELGLKQILLEAVNGGYDRVAFVDGDQSVERYRQALTEAVDEVEITRNDDGTYTYSAIKGGKPVQGEQSVSANRINEVFGKAGSKQLLEEADTKPDEIHTIASGDIEIGGEGMRKFYDTIVPQALGKMLKKLGGDKIEEVNIGKSVNKKIDLKKFEDEAYKLIKGETERLEFEDNLGLNEGDIPESWINELTDLPSTTVEVEARKIANRFASKVKNWSARNKVMSMTQQGFTVTPALAEQVSQGLPLFQAATGGARGSMDPVNNLINLGKNADALTTFHELMHWFVIDLFRTATDPAASELSKSDADILLKSFGIGGSNMQERIANWNAMTLEEQRQHHETTAYNAEIWVATGRAPSVELQGVFERFRRWATRVYKSIRDDLNEIYRQQFGTDLPFLTDEVRGVFDRMLASEEQIARREAIDNFKGMYQTQEESGMNDATWAAYQAEIAEAHEMAVTDLTKATVKQMEWLSGARKGILKAMQATHNALRRSVQGEESVKMDNEPVRKAERFFKTGRMVDTDGKEIEVLVGNKLNKVDVEGMYPTSTTGLAPAVDLTKLRGMTMEGGLAPDLAAEMFGFSSGDELIRALAKLKPFKDELKERTDARMLDEHGGMNTEAEKEEAVNKALANEVRARIVAIENRYLTKVKTPVAVIMQGAKELARTILGRMAIKDIKPRNYVAAEARVAKDKHTAAKAMQSPETAGKSAYTRSLNEQIAAGVEESVAASEALVKSVEAIKRAQAKIDAHKKQYGNVNPAIVAAKASHQQVIQGQLAKEGYKILDEVEKQVSLFKRFFKDDKKIAATRNMDLVNAARSILAFYGLGKHDKLPGAYLKQIQEYNPGLFETISAMVNEAQVGTTDYRLLTFEEFQSMQETVDALWQLAKRENQIKIEGEMVSLGQATEKLEQRLDVIGVPTTIAGETQAVTSKDRAVRHINSMKAILRRVEHWADSTDGAGNVGGPFTKYIWRPISQALDAYRIDRNKYVKRYVELLKQVSLPAGKIAAPELNYTFGAGNGGIGIAELLGAIMHSGNISNLEKLLIGRKWATVSEDGTMDTSRWDAFIARVSNDGTLTKEHFDFIQAVWDLNEELKPMVQKAHYDIEGYYFKEVEATPFTNRFGTYRGGYVPAKTDPFIVRDAQRQAKMSELESDFRAAMPSTGAGFTKSRVKYNKALSLDIRLMAKHIDDVIRYSHVQPAVKDVLRILKKSSFADKLTQMDAMAIDDMLTPWLNRAARQITNESGRVKAFDTFWRTVRSRTGISVMIGNITNAMQQVTGLFMSAIKVSPAHLGNALYAYVASPNKSAQEVCELSSFMKNKMENQIFDLQDQMNELLLNPNKFEKIQKWSSHHGYFLQSAFQNMVDVVTWTGAYNQYLEESGVGMSDYEAQREAVNRADAAVRLTQGTMNPEGIAAFEVGTPFYKTFIQFTGYFNMLANLNTDEYVKIFRDLGWRGNKGKLVSTFMLGFAAQAIISDAIVRTMRGGWEDDDNDGYLDVFMDWIFGSMARSAVAMVPFGSTAMTALSQIVMPVIKGKAGTGYDDRIQSSPSISALTSSTVGVGRAILDVVSEGKEVTGQDVKDVMTLISLSTGVPVTILGRPVSYLVDVNRGKVEPTSTADLMRGLITGTATKESKKR